MCIRDRGPQQIVGHGHIHSNAHVGIHPIRGRLGAPEPHFLLGGENKPEVVGGILNLGQAGNQSGAARAVIQVFGEHFAILDVSGGIIDTDIPQLYHRESLFPAAGTDVDAQIIHRCV